MPAVDKAVLEVRQRPEKIFVEDFGILKFSVGQNVVRQNLEDLK